MKRMLTAGLVAGMAAVVSAEVVPLGTMDGFYRNTAVLDHTLDGARLMWEIPDWMTQTDFPYTKKPFEKELPFADACSVVRLLGGWMDSKQDPHRSHDVNDLADRDEDGKIFYRWNLLKARLDPYIAQGYDLTIVLDNFPHCLPEPGTADSGKGFGQVTPPKDINEWYEFIHAMCLEIKRLYGEDFGNQLRFRMGTEMQDDRRFKGTFEQFCEVYDYAAKAVKEVFPDAKFGPFNRSMPPSHFKSFNGLAYGNVSLLKLAEHCALGTNTATGEIGSPFDFVPRSFYYFSVLNENGKLSNIQPGERMPEFKRMWEAVEAVSPRYKGISREVQEFGPNMSTEGGIYGLDTGARGAAQTLDTIVGLKEIGADRIWHWEVFEKIVPGKQLLLSQGWLYCVFERMRGGGLYVLPVEFAKDHGNRQKALLSVKDDEAVLVVADWNADRVLHDADSLSICIPETILPKSSTVAGMLSFTEENSVFDVIRDDFKAAGMLSKKHLEHRGEPAVAACARGYTAMAEDTSKGRRFIADNWDKYAGLMKDSLMLKPFTGSVQSDGSDALKLNFSAACPSVSVFVFDLK